jgi:hypothetical protein
MMTRTHKSAVFSKSTRKLQKKHSKITVDMPVRYTFSAIFGINTETHDIFPLYNTIVNGQYFQRNISISRGLSFGGVDLYQLIGRDFGGYWNSTTQTLTLVALY